MRSVIIHNLPLWQVTSYDNGLCYEMAHRPSDMAVFFQGDDADNFRSTLEDLTEGLPALDYTDALAVIWSDYSHVANQWEREA